MLSNFIVLFYYYYYLFYHDIYRIFSRVSFFFRIQMERPWFLSFFFTRIISFIFKCSSFGSAKFYYRLNLYFISIFLFLMFFLRLYLAFYFLLSDIFFKGLVFVMLQSMFSNVLRFLIFDSRLFFPRHKV